MNDNWLKTTVLMAAIMALFALIGGMIGGKAGMLLALLFGGGMNLFAWWNSDRMVLSMYNAQEVDANSAPEFYGMVAELAQRAGLPMPRVYVIHEEQPNAFATGRNPENAAVAATSGIMRMLDYRELRGVMAHELAHVKHRDTLISTISATMAGAISALANFAMFFGGRDENGQPVGLLPRLAMAFLAPVAASLIQMAISRAREFEADRGGAEISGDPLALASALQKIEYYAQGIAMPTAEAHPETAQMMIINPLSGGGGLGDLFRTHPHTAERIERLNALARGAY
ncbi:zinc metalloprotease HtpX [Chromobacterium subtsugae]|uniref:Protease HtpX homolog n=1 Tax=Chromobacterium subtsugae TaxID=251747 RepID=A0ABS7F8R8_9NEIS|nr:MULTISPECIES: zinc metalloprotease HtpX [Chromobacterium]KUM05303.1 protease HtpX [Chromobacterium subtsugae]KZE86591.1 protease HtpX [Chromobacterium sp. F49]MBW7565031.1 zinc metalloprotease HtpX [Chromobacterium subtsugae]MBW8286442.1 zinc metalloprotease HtpX [Chromobacterium subtsugae]OBU87713.1 protease HtpX [Chromobacterium subtsugae]